MDTSMDRSADNWMIARAQDIRVWQWLVALLAAGLVAFVLPIPRAAIIVLVFAVAVVKAALVVRNYMHLKAEHLLLYLILLMPVLLFLGLLLTLLPDIGLRR